MVLFPFALIWLVVIMVWVIRNERNQEEHEPRWWARWPRPPRPPRRGGPDRTGGRRGQRETASGAVRERR